MLNSLMLPTADNGRQHFRHPKTPSTHLILFTNSCSFRLGGSAAHRLYLSSITLLLEIIQTLRKTVFGKNLALPAHLVTIRNVSNMPPQSVCYFTAILLMDIVLNLPKFAKKFMIIHIIQS